MAKINIRYFGYSAFKVTEEDGKNVLIDPCLTGIAGRGPSPVSLDEVGDIDLILVTHAAPDHLGDTLELARRSGCSVICGGNVGYYLTKKGIPAEKVLGMLYGVVRAFGGLKIRCVESKHSNTLRQPDFPEGLGMTSPPMGFFLYTESGVGIYAPGDTAIFLDLKLFGELYNPQIGLLGIQVGRYLPPEEAAIVTKWMKLKVVIPHHYAAGSEDPRLFSECVHHESPDTKVVILKPGESYSYEV